jgi:hypothetical protein
MMANHLVLLFLLSLTVFVGCSKDEIHDQNLVSDDNRDQQDGVVFGLVFEVVDEEHQKIAVVYDFSEKDGFIEDEFCLVGLGIANEGAVEICQYNLSNVDAATIEGYEEVDQFRLGKFMLASEDVKEQKTDGNDQCPGDKKLELRPNEQDLYHSVDIPLPNDLQNDANGHACHPNSLEDIELIMNPHIIPTHIVE